MQEILIRIIIIITTSDTDSILTPYSDADTIGIYMLRMILTCLAIQ